MKTRIVSGIILVILLVVILTSGGIVSAVCLCMVALVASYELSRAFALRDTRDRNVPAEEMSESAFSFIETVAIKVQDKDQDTDISSTSSEPKYSDGKKSVSGMEIVGYLGVILHYTLIILTDGDPRYFIGTMITFFFAETLIYVVRFPAYHISRLSDTIFCFLYAPVCLSFLCLIRDLEYGEWFVWLPFLAWVSDTFAYFSGRAFGKRKLCPKLSPHKTIAGSVGGFLGAVVLAGLYGYFLYTYTPYNERVIWACLTIGFACGIFSQLGDLLASGIKRDRGIKDYGKLIPGHGGIMDRFDSVIFITPIVYFLITTLLRLR